MTEASATSDWRDDIFTALKAAGIRQVGYVPDAGHSRLIELCHADPAIRAIPLTSEEEGIGLAAGAWLGGQRAALWRLDQRGANLIRRCLVLLADHELNASTFVARCVASTGATPYAVVSGALAALSGRRHGGASASAEALLHEIVERDDPLAVMAARLARNEMLPGLGHPLYPDGDPRAATLLNAAMAAIPASRPLIEAAVAAARQLVPQPPNVDFALAAATTALGLPQGTALAIFILGRTVGWIAHAIEQYQSDVLIRPRARYTGPRPGEENPA